MLVVDAAGLGGGVVDRLKELREFRVEAFLGASASRSKDYPRRRDEAWFEFAEKLPGLDLPADEELASDLLAPRYSLDSAGRRVVEAKGETKRRLRRSPDRADAVVMAFAADRRVQPIRVAHIGTRRPGVRRRRRYGAPATPEQWNQHLGLRPHDPVADALGIDRVYSHDGIAREEAKRLGRRRRSG